MKVRYFKTGRAFRAWLDAHHADTAEVWVGCYHKRSGRGGITYHEALDEALCFGWIDGVVRNVDEHSCARRFTPRKARSRWSAINVRRAGELLAAGLMAPAGAKAFAARDLTVAPYSYQHPRATLPPAFTRQFKARPEAWAWFSTQPPGYRRTATFWVMSAKQESTRARRLGILIAESESGERIGILKRPTRA